MPFPATKNNEHLRFGWKHDLSLDLALDLGQQFATNGAKTVYVVRDPEGAEGVGLHLTDFPVGADIAAICTGMGRLENISRPLDSLALASVVAVELHQEHSRPFAVIHWAKEGPIWRVCPFDMLNIRQIRPLVSWAAFTR